VSVPAADPDAPAPLPSGLVVAGATVLTAALTVWAAFLVPLRVGSLPAPAWLLPLAGALVLGRAAARRAGLPGALAPAVVWFLLSWPVLGAARTEGDLVVPGTGSGYAYLFGGLLAWAALVVGASGAHRRRRPASPAAPARRSSPHGDAGGRAADRRRD
jgi:MYXO-CTERM domain-containing protein